MKQDRAVFSRWIKLVLSAAVLVLLAGGAWFYRAQMQSTRHAAEDQLSAIAQLKVDQIVAWRGERLGDAVLLSGNPFLADAVARFTQTPDTATSQSLVACFRNLQTQNRYADILLVAPDGRVLLSARGSGDGQRGAFAAVLPTAIRERKPMFIDLHLDDYTSAPHCAVVAPLFAGGGTAPAPVGAIVLIIDPGKFLYPMIQSWPQPSHSAETLLVRRDGKDALFLNPLRFKKGAALNLRTSLRQTDILAVKGLLGERGVVQGLDYRGVSVVGVVEPIPDSPWLMVAKLDAAEVYAVSRFRSLLIMAAVLVLIATIGAIGLLLSQRERKAHFVTLYQSEAARRAATERHSITLKSIGDGVISTDAQGRVELVNPVAEALTGWTDAEARGRSLQEIFHIISEDTGERMDDPVARVLREGLVVGLANHTLLIARDGEMRPIADSGAPIRNDENEIAGAVLVFRDQSEERRARKALEKSEAMLKESQRVAALGHYTVDVTTGIWSSSETLDEIYGIDANFTRDFDGWVGLMPRDQREEMASRYADHVRAGQNPMDSEYRILRANDGAERWVRSRGTLAFDRGGQPVTMFGIIQDITDRKLKEEALRTSEAMLKESQRVAALGHYYFDVATGIWSSSEMLDEVYGIDANFTRDVDGWIGLIHPDQREEMAAYFADHVLAGRNTFDREYRILRANDGAERWVHGRGNLAFDSEGQPVTMFGIIQDVTDRKLKDEALRTSEARYRKAQAIGRVGHWEYDLATETFWGSEEANKISGFDPDHPGFSVDEVGSCFPDRIRVHQALLDLIERGTAYDIEFDIVAVDGSGIKTVHSTAVLEKDADGKPVKVIGVVQDITERKLMEEELRTNEARYRKAQAIGRVGHWEYHPMSDKYYGSEEAKRIYGFDPDQPGFSPDEVEACIPDRKRVHQALLDLLEKGTAYDLEFDIVAADSGKTKTIQSIAVLESDAAGRPVKVSGVVQDITERKQMEDQLRKLSRTYSLLSEVNQIIVHERDTHAVFEAVCRISVEVGGFYMVRIRLPDPQTQEFVTIAQAGNENWVEKWNSAPDHGESDSELTASVVRTGKHVVVNDLEIDPDTAAWLNKLQLPCRATAAFPLAIAGEVCGTLNLYSGEPGFFDIEEVRVLDGMAADISFAMAFNKQEQQRREAEDRTEEHLLHLSALRAIDLAISSSLDLRVTLTILLEQVIGTLRVDASAVFLLSPGINQLEYAAGRGFSGTDITGVRLKLGECIIGQSALERRTINIPNLDEVKSNPLCAELSAKEGFVAMVAVPLIAKGKVKGVLGVFHRSALNPNPDWLEFMEALAGQAAIAIDSSQLFDQLQRSNMEQALAYDATIEGWSKAMDLRDEETEGHSLRVTDMTMKMARAAGISETEMVHVRRGALLHDMGKMGIPDSILLKPGPLTDEEMTIMRTHPSLAFDMLAPIPFLRPALDIPGCHHEKWDGTGYPRGLKGERIPLAARLFAVVDVWDALRSDRPYRKAWEEERVLEHIRAQSGTHFEPKAVEVFFRVLAENKEA